MSSIQTESLLLYWKEIFSQWKASNHPPRRSYRERKSTPERDTEILKAAVEYLKPGEMFTVSHLDRALTESDFPVNPLPSNRPTAEDMKLFQSMSRDELIIYLFDQGPHSHVYRAYQWACKEYGFSPITIQKPLIPDSEIDDFETQRARMSATECRQRYEKEPEFRRYQDASDQRAAWLRDLRCLS